MDDNKLRALVGRTNAALRHGLPPGTLLVDDFEIVPGFGREANMVDLIHDPDGWDSTTVPDGRPSPEPIELPTETMWLRYSIIERLPGRIQADEHIVVKAD